MGPVRDCATAHLTVYGYGVGQGSPVRVTLRDARNKAIGRGQAEMYDGQAVVDVEIARRAAGLAVADIELTELDLEDISPPLTVVPFAELDRAEWGQDGARDGDAVGLSCRVTGTAEGVKRLEGQTAEVEILHGASGEGDGLSTLFEPVVTLRVPVADSGRGGVASGVRRRRQGPDHDAGRARRGRQSDGR